MAKRLALLVTLLAVPSLGSAQLVITESNDTDKLINHAECANDVADGLSFSWTFPAFVATAGGQYTLTASDTINCTPPSNNQTIQTSTIGTVDATSANGVFPASGTVGVAQIIRNLAMSCDGSKNAVYFCVTLSTAATGTAAVTATLQLDLQKPPAPNLISVSPGDSSLHVTAQQGQGGVADGGASGSTDSFTITAVNHANPNETHTTGRITASGNDLSGTIGGLTNNVPYDVTMTALSPGGNPSGPSNSLSGTPIPVDDFWRIYRDDKGRETGGCAAGAAGMLALLAVPLALRAWRRKRS